MPSLTPHIYIYTPQTITTLKWLLGLGPRYCWSSFFNMEMFAKRKGSWARCIRRFADLAAAGEVKFPAVTELPM